MDNVLVVGGGIGGLAAATALAHRGVEVAVLEARAALGEVGAGLTLWPNALAVLARLGVDEAVLAREDTRSAP
jgi:salicylate hydroxylase